MMMQMIKSGKSFPLLLVVTSTLISVTVCRQMCYSCNYVGNSINEGYDCVTYPRNWTRGNWRLRCNTLCTTQATYNKESGKATFLARGCSATIKGNDNYCEEGATEIRCFFTCQDHYCNDGPGIDAKYFELVDIDGSTAIGASVLCIILGLNIFVFFKKCLQ